RWLRSDPEQYPPPWKYRSAPEGSLPGTSDHSPGTPSRSTFSRRTSSATGQLDPISSSRFRRAAHPIGRGLDASSSRMASISVGAMASLRRAAPDLLRHPTCPIHLLQPLEDRLSVQGHRPVGRSVVTVVAAERVAVPVEDQPHDLAVAIDERRAG